MDRTTRQRRLNNSPRLLTAIAGVLLTAAAMPALPVSAQNAPYLKPAQTPSSSTGGNAVDTPAAPTTAPIDAPAAPNVPAVAAPAPVVNPPVMPGKPVKPAAAIKAPPSAATAASMAELQKSMEQKRYQDAIKLASKLLALHGPAAGDLDRFQITMIKGEAQVGAHLLSAAAATFKTAQKESKDPHEIALAKWTGELFSRARGTTYVPKTIGAGLDKPGPIDLMDPERRKDAFAALLTDELSALEPKLKSAATSQSLPLIWPVIEQVQSLDQLDQIANGNDDKTSEAANYLIDHSRNLLTNALKGMWARVNDIDNHANIVTSVPSTSVVNGQYQTVTVSKKNGLSNDNKTELTNDIALCAKIHDAAESFMAISKNGDKDWGAVLNDTDRVAGRANDVLNADYGTAVSSSVDYNDNTNTNTVTNGNLNSGGVGNNFNPGGVATGSGLPSGGTTPSMGKGGTGQNGAGTGTNPTPTNPKPHGKTGTSPKPTAVFGS